MNTYKKIFLKFATGLKATAFQPLKNTNCHNTVLKE